MDEIDFKIQRYKPNGAMIMLRNEGGIEFAPDGVTATLILEANGDIVVRGDIIGNDPKIYETLKEFIFAANERVSDE